MQPVVTAAQMREIDRLTTEKYGIPSLLLMENAAHAAARVITEKLGGSVAGKSFLIVCGTGNNGGDGAALARILWLQNASVHTILFGKTAETKGDAKTNFEILSKLVLGHLNIYPNSYFYFSEIETYEQFDQNIRGFRKSDVVIDALFGTGLTRPLKGEIKKVVAGINHGFPKGFSGNPLIVSLDIPSGLNSDLAEPYSQNLGASARPDLTITFTAPKLANVFPPAFRVSSELVTMKIGSPEELIDDCKPKLFLADREDTLTWLGNTRLHSDSYKKTRGTALIIGGSENYSGAVALAANACFASGAGMVTAATPQAVKDLIAAKLSDEIILKSLEKIVPAKEKVEVVALGCGMADDAKTKKFIRETVKNRVTPMVLDAEALNALAPFKLQGSKELPLVLTPHIGEFKRLLGSDEEITDKIATARGFAEKHQVILVLKGERSLIAAPDGRVVINPTGNAGISRAGAGDTLTGIITGFIAQTLATPHIKNQLEVNAAQCADKIFEAVIAALYLSGVAGDLTAERFGQRMVSATDIRNCLGAAIQSVRDKIAHAHDSNESVT